jgi:hypothetical protein
MTEHIRYIDRTRAYYAAQGFDRPYQWAHYDETPFHKPTKPLSESSVAIVLTAIHPKDHETAMVGRTASSYALEDAPENFFTDDLSWDKVTTHTDDRDSFFPLEHLRQLKQEGAIGRIAPRFHFVPTEYSQRQTVESDAPAIRDACIKDEVDVAILVPL